jgi:hypothetical protein
MQDEQKGGRATGRMPRRATDLVEDVVAWTLTALLLVTATVALIVGIGTAAGTADEVRAEAGTRTMVTAMLLESVPLLALEQPPSDVPASWTGPDGQPRTGVVTVQSANAGDQVPIWIDRDGARVPPPPTESYAVGAGIVSGLGVLLPGWTVLALVWLLVRRATATANARWWERKWDAVGPHWTERR